MMKRIRFHLAIALVFSLPISAKAQVANQTIPAQNNADPMVSYRAYNTAIEAGDISSAASNAQLAWRAAEIKWGASKANTAALAYNAAWAQELAGRFELAIEPARRAALLFKNANNSYKLEEAEFLLANAEYNLASPEQKLRQTHQFASKAKKVANEWNDTLIIGALNSISANFLELERPGNAKDFANLAISQIKRLNIEAQFIEAIAIFNRGRANMFLRNYQESVSDLIEARVLYGAPASENDLAWGKLAAWHYAAKALAVSNSLHEYRYTEETVPKTTFATNEFRGMTSAERGKVASSQIDCRNGDLARIAKVGTDISFPDEQQRNGLVAGVLIKIDLLENGEVENARIIGAVPSEGFGANSLKAVSTWRYIVPPNTTKECRKGVLVPIIFAYKW